MSATEYALHGSTAVIHINNPPVNGLGLPLRQGLVEGLDKASRDSNVKAIVLIGTDTAFSGGADITEFNTPLMSASPNLWTVLDAAENSQKPVIAAISGVVMGGGLELALACHYRVATAETKVALPEVKLGLLPGAGGTQRLPRVVGLETALNMIVSGNAVPAKMLAGTKLFDQMVEGDVLASALAFADKVVADGAACPKVRDLRVKHSNAEGYLQVARQTVNAMAGKYPAPRACLECVAAAATKPFDEGIKVEAKLFAELMNGSESKAMRHIFFGERAAPKIADVPKSTPSRELKQAAVIGAGLMGGGITMNFIKAGLPVILLETKQEALDRGVATIKGNYERQVKKGKITEEQLAATMAMITPTLEYGDLSNADIVIEAVFEDISVKQAVFEKLDSVMKPGAILASNTSTINLDRIAEFTKRPEDVIGLHFFSPAHVMKLLEVVRGEKTSKDVLATCMGLAKKMRKLAIVSGVCDGFIGNRMVEEYGRQAGYLIEEGASPWQVDKALEKWGMAMGIFKMADMAGLDIGANIRKRRRIEMPDLKYPKFSDMLVDKGRLGQKSGSGMYLYKPGDRTAYPDPEVDKMLADFRQAEGITPREISDEEIVARCILALTNEGAKILQEGIAQRASDIDMAYIFGYGFPPYRGGPMLYADNQGLYDVARQMRGFADNPHGDPEFWEPAPLLAELAANDKTFN